MREPCWVCGARDQRPYLSGEMLQATAADLRITDDRYGSTAPLVQCRRCSFIQACPCPASDLTALYAELDDPEYEAGHDYRLQQMERMLAQSLRHRPGAERLLDVGAGSGLMVEAAGKHGMQAVGVEPSHALVRAAHRRGLPVHQGVLPHPELDEPRFDLVTCLDVIEHVRDPVGLLRHLRDQLAPGGLAVVSTPDVESWPRRLLGRRWWHFRTAHVGFFPTSALDEALRRAGLRRIARERQVWTFSLAYLSQRVGRLLAGERGARLLAPLGRSRRLARVQLPVDTRDSWIVFAEPL